MKYIAPGGWFSLEYPAGWREFEDTEESFLFYDPDKWSGNFRISAYRGADTNYGKECVSYELKENPAAELTLIRGCLLYTSRSPRDISGSRMPSSA